MLDSGRGGIKVNKQTFAQALKREREARAMPPSLVAERVYVSIDEYNKWENAEELPSLESAQRLADVFGISLDRLTSPVYQPKIRMGAEDGISEAEKAQLLAKHENEDTVRYNRGRIMMTIIIAVDVVSLVLSFFTANILSSIFRIVMLICLWRGHSWARYVYTALTAIGTLITFAITGQLFDTHILLGIVALAEVAWGVIVCVLLIANKSIEEFLYEQKTS